MDSWIFRETGQNMRMGLVTSVRSSGWVRKITGCFNALCASLCYVRVLCCYDKIIVHITIDFFIIGNDRNLKILQNFYIIVF